MIALISALVRLIFPKIKQIRPESDVLPEITCPYRINRMIRSKYRAGDYEVVHPVQHHYLFEIDGKPIVLGILSVVSAIESLEKYEAHLTDKFYR